MSAAGTTLYDASRGGGFLANNNGSAALAGVPDLDALLSCSDSCFKVLDLDGHILYLSPSASRVLRVDPASLLGLRCVDLVHADDRPKMWASLRDLRAQRPPTPTPFHVLFRLRGAREADGSPIVVEDTLCCDGEYIYGVVCDAAGQKRTEEMLRSFLLITSHDLRTPCHGMQCASQLLSARPGVAADTEAAYLLRVVRSGCALMLAIINDVLELKRLEDEAANGARPVASAPRRGRVLLRDAFEAALEVCRVACSRRVHWAAEEQPDALPLVLEGSPERVQQLLHDLLIAAARFCAPDAQIEAALSCEPVTMAEPGSALGDVELRVQLFVPHAPLSAAQLRAAFDLHDPAQTDDGAAIALGLGTARATARAKGGDATLANDAAAGGLRLEARARLFSPGSAAHLEETTEGDAPSPRKAAASAAAAVASGLFRWDGSVTTTHALTADDIAQREPASVVEPPPAALLGGSPPTSPLSPSSMLLPRSPPSQALVARMFSVLTSELDQAFKVAEKRDDGRVVYVYASPSMTHMYGWRPADMLGRDIRDFHHPEDMEVPPLKQVLACEVPEDKSQLPEGHVDELTGLCFFTSKHRFLLPDGSFTWLSSSGCYSDRHAYLMCKDVRVQAAKEAALRRLLLAVSRELREPANGVLAAAALLARRESVFQDAEAAFCARALGASCRLLLGIVQNVLCMRRVEAGELELSAEAFDPAAAVDDVLQVCRLGSAGAASVSLRAAPLPRAVVGDASVFTQGLQNLVTNALRFEAGRGVRVSLRCEPVAASEDATHALLATVADQGRGLTAEEVESVFRAYAAAPSERGGGTGLGLFVAREYARRAGGDVTVVSEPGKGAAFTLRLPVRVTSADAEDWVQRVSASGAAVPAPSGAARPRSPSPPRSSVAPEGLSTPPPKRQHSAAGRRLRVLLAEDHELNRLLVQRLLSQAGFDVRTAVDGADALQQLRAGARSFHLALLDMAMPELSGPEAARAFRAWEAERATPSASRLPIVALTANVLEQHAAECAAAGMDAFLTKPLRAGALAQLRDMAADYAARTSAKSGGFLD